MKLSMILIAGSFLISIPVLADEISPIAADSEGLEQFDQSVSQGKPVAAHPSNFGGVVSAEAKKLRDSAQKTSGEFGAWVSKQRRNDSQPQVDGVGDAGAAGNSGHGPQNPLSAIPGAGNSQGNGNAGNSQGNGNGSGNGHGNGNGH